MVLWKIFPVETGIDNVIHIGIMDIVFAVFHHPLRFPPFLVWGGRRAAAATAAVNSSAATVCSKDYSRMQPIR